MGNFKYYRKENWKSVFRWSLKPLLCLSIFYSTGCTEIFEVRLETVEMTLLMPQDSLVTPVSSQLFWWDEVQGATGYRIQVASPSFDSIFTLLADNLIDSNKFELTLNPGTYQWRVKAVNSATESQWFVRTLIIDSTLDLSFQTLLLSKPTSQDTSNSLPVNFSWQPLYSADTYAYEIWQPNLLGVQITSGNISSNSFNYSLPSEGAYFWRVRAENVLSVTAYASRSFFIDTTQPLTSVLSMPLDNDTVVQGDVEFSWVRTADSGSSLRDSVIIAEDSNFTTIVSQSVVKTTGLTKNLTVGTYYWKLITKDRAGNQSQPSATRVLYIE